MVSTELFCLGVKDNNNNNNNNNKEWKNTMKEKIAPMTMDDFQDAMRDSANEHRHYRMTPYGPLCFSVLPWGIMIDASSDDVFVVVNNVRYTFVFRCEAKPPNDDITCDNNANMYRHDGQPKRYDCAVITVRDKTMATLLPYAQEIWDSNQDSVLSQRKVRAEQDRRSAESDVQSASIALNVCKKRLQMLEREIAEGECGQ